MLFIAATTSGTLATGSASVTVSNGSYLDIKSTVGIGVGQSGAAAGSTLQQGYLYVDATSTFGGVLINVGRYSTTGSIVLEGTSTTAGATLNGHGTGYLTAGTNSQILLDRTFSIGVNSAATLSGATLKISTNPGSDANSISMSTGANLTLYGSTILFTYAATNAINSTSSSTISFNNSQVSMSGNVLLNGTQYFGLNSGSQMTVSNIAATNSATFSVAGSSLSTGNITLSSVASTVIQNSSVNAGILRVMTTSGGITITNSTLTLSTATFDGTNVGIYNSTLSVADRVWFRESLGALDNKTISNTKLSATALEATFTNTHVYVTDGSAVTLSAGSQATLATAYTGYIYAENAAITIENGGALGVGRLVLGDTGKTASFNMTGGVAFVQAAAYVGTNGAYVNMNVSGGQFYTSASGSIIIGGVDGHGRLNVSGTGSVYTGTLSLRENGTVSGTLYVQGASGTQQDVAGQTTVNYLELRGNSMIAGDLKIATNAALSLVVSGNSTGFSATNIYGNLAIEGASTLDIDLSNLIVDAMIEQSGLVLLIASNASGLDDLSINYTDPTGYTATIAWVDAGGGVQNLLLTVQAIPEPAMAARLMGLMSLLLVSRRRK